MLVEATGCSLLAAENAIVIEQLLSRTVSSKCDER